ncbi:MAG: TonB-dependent receptor plug domain-containing protein [Alphaproteobacteria bacterium]|nr:TonB-dependent receptor plug domain-containing protein [Alphaproteobacteria bacterium]
MAWIGATLSAHAQLLAQADLSQMSIEQLANVEITSVSKMAQPLSGAPAPVTVISHDDIIASGASQLAEMLRLAPNIEVMQTNPSHWIVASRGLNGNDAAQSFPNTLLVLVDGRSVYSPLFTGVYWDMQQVLPENIERIEVVSGPGGTLWGANAVNGVVNVVTRKASATQGGFLELTGGDHYSSATLQYGGAVGDDVRYRAYASTFYDRAFDRPSGADGHDGWSKPQGGFRIDWTPGADSVVFSGDIFGGTAAQLSAANQRFSGGNLMARWDHPLGDGDTLSLAAYYDQAHRASDDGGAFILNTYDFSAQHNFSLGGWNNIVWGLGDRIAQYRITAHLGGPTTLQFAPPGRTLNLFNLFAEDHIPVTDTVQLTLGLKLENDPFSGMSAMPSGRLAWQISSTDLLWGAISRSVRSPTPFDTDVQELLGSTLFIKGNPAFRPTSITAYEAGYRGNWSSDFSVSLTLFEDVYDDLRSIEPAPTVFLPLTWGNLISGDIHGVEASASLQVTDWWRLTGGITWQHADLKFDAGASTLLGIAQSGDDPHQYASLRSSMRLMDGLTFNADLREVGELPNPHVAGYAELNTQLNWRATDTLDFELSGFNLLHGRHLEYVSGSGDMVERSVVLRSRLRF